MIRSSLLANVLADAMFRVSEVMNEAAFDPGRGVLLKIKFILEFLNRT